MQHHNKEAVMGPTPFILRDAFKQYRYDQDKTLTPEQTVARFKERLDRKNLKILDDIVRIDNGRLGIPVYFSLCGPEAQAAIGNYKQMGKGATEAQAQASAVMELGERFSLFSYYRNPDNFISAPKQSVNDPTLSFEQIARSVEDASDDLGALESFFNELPLQWCWAHNLTREAPVMIPFNWFWTINEFNGSSAGNCNEEALCQGISEVVERHVSSRISREEIRVPLVDKASIKDPVCLELIGKYDAAGIQLFISDFSLEMGIPSIGVLAWDPGTFPEKSEIVWTAGTMPSANKALCRSLTEIAQLAGDFNSSGNYEASGLPKFRELKAARFITHPGRKVFLEALPEIGDNNIKVEVQNCIDALSQRNMDVFTVDVRHPVLDLPAFYTMVPGTQFRERAAHGSVGMIMAKIITGIYSTGNAIDLLRRIHERIPGKYYLEFYQAQCFIEESRYEEAQGHLNRAIALSPPAEDLASIYTYSGICFKEMEQYSDALKMLEKGNRIDPERTDTLNLMGFCHFKLKAHLRAIDCFQKLVAINPSSAIDYANIGANFRAMGDKAKAIEHYQLALSLDPGIDFARDHLVQMGVKG
jgi:ribosomal protein S12 methylthiotransferase accessory factor